MATQTIVDRWDPELGWRFFVLERPDGAVKFEAVAEVEADGITVIDGRDWTTCGMTPDPVTS